jgi:hypothetical protein
VQISPTDADWAFANEVHGAFVAKPGAQYIATAFALAHLSAVLNSERPHTVLEFGAGIGTITQLLLQHPSHISHVTATEKNPFCVQEFAKNIGAHYAGRYELVTEIDRLLLLNKRYDLVVIDGLLEPDQYKLITLGTTCFVEGSRTPTRRELNEQLANRGLNCPFENYNRGTRYFSFYMRHDSDTGQRSPKFKFRRVLKGCWIGKVGVLETRA